MSMTDRELLRHAVAILAYRGAKPLRAAPASFAGFDTGGGHTPLRVLAHISDLLDWALSHARGEGRWNSAEPGTWDAEVARFHEALAAFDAYLASDAPIKAELPRLLAGPIADALTHVGQLMMLRRMTGSPVYGENYFVADIVAGRVGPDQSPPRKPF
jgi:hypothetical protein